MIIWLWCFGILKTGCKAKKVQSAVKKKVSAPVPVHHGNTDPVKSETFAGFRSGIFEQI
jgi:hypothetical protein